MSYVKSRFRTANRRVSVLGLHGAICIANYKSLVQMQVLRRVYNDEKCKTFLDDVHAIANLTVVAFSTLLISWLLLACFQMVALKCGIEATAF